MVAETAKALDKRDLVAHLRKEILGLQGFTTPSDGTVQLRLDKVTDVFPGGTLPTRAIHEFISTSQETNAASIAFVAAIAASLTQPAKPFIWISGGSHVFPPALHQFGLQPDQVVFVHAQSAREALWAAEEALRYPGLTAVVAEISALDFTSSQKLQLAVERSHVTGLLLRHAPRQLNANACAARWRVTPVKSHLPIHGMPGLGHPAWTVTLEKVKNGRTGSWQLEWKAGQFHLLTSVRSTHYPAALHRRAG